MQGRGFIEGEDKKGVEESNGMKDGLGGEKNCGTLLSLVGSQQLG
jgi:hypothetical protein